MSTVMKVETSLLRGLVSVHRTVSVIVHRHFLKHKSDLIIARCTFSMAEESMEIMLRQTVWTEKHGAHSS